METFSCKTEDFHIVNMINSGYHKVIYKIKDFFEKKFRYIYRHRNTIRIQLKNGVETFSDKTGDYHLTYVW